MNVEEISKIEKNGKTFYKVKADGRSFTCFDSVEGFKQLEDGLIKSGMNCKIEYTETQGEFNGSPVTYKNIVKFSEIGTAAPVKTPTIIPATAKKEVSDDVWAKKDRRITRMSCLARAIEFIALNKEDLPDGTGVSEDTIINIAKKFETQYVYKNLDGENL